MSKLVLDRYASAKHDLDSFDGLYREHALSKLTNPIRVMDYLKEYAKDNGIKVSDILKDLGYDGVHDGIEWVAFDPTQVKSATGNIGTFDGSNQKFNFSENSEVKSYERKESAIQANRHIVANMESVCDLTGNEFSRNGEPIIDRVDAFFAKHGNSVYNEELGDIDMVHSSIHDDLSHGKGHDKITAFAAIPDVLQHGRVVEYSNNWKDRGYDAALVAAPITIGGEPYFAGCRVMRKVNDNSQRYYIHEVIFYGEKEPSETFTTRFSANGGATRASDSSSIKIVLSEIAKIKRDAESSQFNLYERQT